MIKWVDTHKSNTLWTFPGKSRLWGPAHRRLTCVGYVCRCSALIARVQGLHFTYQSWDSVVRYAYLWRGVSEYGYLQRICRPRFLLRVSACQV